MEPKEIRVAVVGAGDNTRKRHLPGLRAQPGVRIVGVCNRSRESAAAVADAFNIPRLYDHWRQAVEDPGVDAVVIGTWPNLHARVAIGALSAGKHVLCEARLARDAAEARAMLAAAEARPDLVAQVVPAPFSLEVDATVCRLLAEGWLGEILLVEHLSGAGFLDRTGGLHWRKDAELSGLNAMALGIVYEMVLRWVGEATRVVAMAKTFVRMRPAAGGTLRAVRVPDHLDVLADLACGAQLHLQQSGVAALRAGAGTWVFGSEGVLRFDDGRLVGARRGEAGLQPVDVPAAERIGWRVEEEFVNAIRGREAVRRTTFADGVKYMEFTEAVARSAAQGRAVQLPLALDG